MNNPFLEQAHQGRNEFWRYLVTTISTIGVAITVQIILVVAAIILGNTTNIESLPSLFLFLIVMIPFPFSLAALWGGLGLLHKRPLMSIINPAGKIAWKRVFLSALVWFLLAGLSDIILGFFDPANYVFTFDLNQFAPYFLLAIILVPIQTTTKEMIFRGYLAQWIGRYSRHLWVPLVVPSLVFTLLHGLNPEVLTYGAWLTLPFYFGIGLLLGWITLRFGGLELAIGLHAANNLYAVLMVTFPGSALPSPAIFTIQRYDPVIGLAVFAVMAVLYLAIFYTLQHKRLPRTVTALILAGVMAGSLVSPAQARSFDAERFDVRIEMQPDGSLLVTETVVFRFQDGPFSYAFRHLALNELDRIEVLSTTLDGQAVLPGTQPGQVEISADSDPIELTWHFEPTSDASRTVGLTYRVIGNVRQVPGGDGISWQAIPAEHEYEIRFASITLVYPPGIEPLEPVSLVGQNASIETMPGWVVFHLEEIGINQPITIHGRFPQASLLIQPPEWQALIIQRGQQVQAALPYMVIISVGLLLIAVFIAESLRRKNFVQYSPSFSVGSLPNPPDDLAPGLAGFLVSNGRANGSHFIAVLLDLAHRGYLRMEQKEESGIFKAKDFQITPLKGAQGLRPHEAFVHQFLFQTRSTVLEEVLMSRISRKISGKLSLFSAQAQAELEASGTLIPGSLKQRDWMVAVGFVLFFLSLCLAFLGAIFVMIAHNNLATVGMLLLGGALGMLVGGFVFWIYNGSWKVFTIQGKQRQERWNSFRLYIRELIKTDTLLKAEWLDAYLAYSVSFGLGDRWVKAFKDRGLSTLLNWVYLANGDFADSTILTAVIVTSTADSSSAGSSAGGGGASGAG